jgi:2-polyprenyl-3-methyl-5-hydroxy-6-metoxy-1,4-benzoquinol methylase
MVGMPDDRYVHGHHASVLRSHRWRTAENSAGYLLGELAPGMSVLDVGCGPGTITLDFARRVAPGRVVGIDRAADVIEAAAASAVAAGVAVEFRTDDAYALAAADDSFDVVHAHQVLQHLTDPVAALVEWRRVCRPGGVVAARDADYAAMCWYPADPGLDRWLELYHRVARGTGGEPDAGRHLVAWAHAAGFTDVTASASAWCFASPEDREWWGGTWAERVISSSFAEQALAQEASTPAELAELSAVWRRWATHPDAWFAILHAEILCRA